MIPIRLELKNFMSYGADVPALDLSGMHTVCLSGENGNGKSALLDAITWALWGESRAGKNKHDELVRLGADEMSVTLTFAMDGQIYRVLRKRSKRASGNQWELQQETPDAGLGTGWRALSGNNAGETEKAIQKLLRMSYDTFLNSAYLRQGQADQFVKQTPGKRKEILADILDLSRYDQLEQKAKERANDAKAEAVDLERTLHVLDAELAGEAGHRDARVLLQAQLADVTAQGESLKTEMYATLARLQELDAQKKAADALHAQIATYAREMDDYARDVAALQLDIGKDRALLARRVDIEARHAALLDVRARLEQLAENVTQWNRGQQALAAAQREWDAAEHSLRLQVQRAADAHEEAAQSVKELPRLHSERAACIAQTQAHDPLAREAADAEAHLPDAQEHLSALKEEDASIGAQIVVWQERLAALAQQQGVCQVCNAPLKEERAAAVRQEYQAALDDLIARRKDLRGEGARAKAEVAALQGRVAAFKAVSRDAQAARERLLLVEQQTQRIEELAAQAPKRAAHLAEVTGVLQGGQFAPELRAKIEKIGAALTRYAGAEDAQAQAKQEQAALSSAEREMLELAQAEKTLAGAESRLARAQEQGEQRRKAREELARQVASLADVENKQASLTARRDELKALEAERRRTEGSLHQDIGSHERELARCAGLRVQRGEKDTALAAALSQHEVHDQLAKAFGKKGVQALIIENAVPELQEEANRLLERLTDGDMSLFFDTVREAKGKGNAPIETLDIKVSDSLGTRPLEMYSGGEGFRAAFALRLALSKLLARRAGARLQTLIIDEGFGTQDGKGREKLVDALHVIGSEFERIIVITHIDELKDAFAARIEVTKTPAGSQITVLEGASG